MDSEDHQEPNGIDGELVDFEWTILPGHTILGLLREIQQKVTQNGIKPEVLFSRPNHLHVDVK